MSNEPLGVHMGFTDERFAAGTHMCLVYRDEAERRAIVSRYLESGMLDGERVYYFADDATAEEVETWLADLDVELTETLSVQSAVGTYCPTGTFVPEQMCETLRETYRQVRAAGLERVRVSGEMSWALHGIPGSERVIEYEEMVNAVLETHPVTAMCQYDARRFSGSTIFEALQVHPYMIVQRQLVRNPFYRR